MDLQKLSNRQIADEYNATLELFWAVPEGSPRRDALTQLMGELLEENKRREAFAAEMSTLIAD